MTTTDYILQLISLAGGLALFLFGMDTMGKALEHQAGGRLQTILAKMSSNVFKGFFLGLAVTAVIQSSSATTVMVVGFVNSGIMTLHQAIGIIMGSNIGTTVTSWILSLTSLEGSSLLVRLFKPDTLAPLLGAVGIVLTMFFKSEKKKGVGTILLGFLTLMTGMSVMSGSMRFLENEAWFGKLMVSFSNPIFGIALGTVLTAVIQSSSASVGILQSLSLTGLVSMGTAIPIIMGQNIGTCVTALLSSVGGNRNARRTAMVHLYFNLIGVILFSVLFYGIGLISPWSFLAQPADPFSIAVMHTAFNVFTTIVLLPLSRVLEWLAVKSVPESKGSDKVELLDPRLLSTPAVAIQRSREITGRMAAASISAFHKAVELTHSFDENTYAAVAELEEKTDRYEDALGTYLVQLSAEHLTTDDNRILNTLLYTIGDFERIADHAAAIAGAGREIAEKPVKFSQQAKEELAVLEQAVTDVLERTCTAFLKDDLELARKVEPQEQVVDVLVRELKSRHINRLREGLCTVEYGFVLDDLLTAYERIADHCSSIAVEMLQAAEGKMDAHEYLNALKSGELGESEIFSQRFQQYRQQYVFPDETAEKDAASSPEQ